MLITKNTSLTSFRLYPITHKSKTMVKDGLKVLTVTGRSCEALFRLGELDVKSHVKRGQLDSTAEVLD